MPLVIDNPMMACGCVARSTHTQDHDGLGPNHPSCVVHFSYAGDVSCQVVERPSLDGRMALCGYSKKRNGEEHTPVPSSYGLPFFQFKGEDSPAALDYCKHCPYTRNAHRFGPFYNPGRCPNCEKDGLFYSGDNTFVCAGCDNAFHAAKLRAKHNPTYTAHTFEPHGAFDYDTYYCGCWGWD